MCGRYTLHTPAELLRRRFRIEWTAELTARYNIAPSQPVLAVAIGRAGRTALELRWGFVPGWSEQGKPGRASINARSESAARSPLYRRAFARQRCLILADGFYEWSAGPERRAHWIHRADGAPFAFAGLYSVWRPPQGGEPLLSCAILTAPAAAPLDAIHDRMPLILQPAHEDAWIDRELRDPARVQALLAPEPASALRAHPVSSAVNSAAHEGPELIRPLG